MRERAPERTSLPVAATAAYFLTSSRATLLHRPYPCPCLSCRGVGAPRTFASRAAHGSRLQKEIARFQKHKLDDFTESVLHYAASQAQYYQQEEGLWAGVAEQLEQSGSPKHGGGSRDRP